MALEFSKEDKTQIIEAVIAFVDEQFEEEIGPLRAEAILDFFIKMVGNGAYNLGVSDAQAYLQLKLSDMPIDVYEEVEYAFKDSKDG